MSISKTILCSSADVSIDSSNRMAMGLVAHRFCAEKVSLHSDESYPHNNIVILRRSLISPVKTGQFSVKRS